MDGEERMDGEEGRDEKRYITDGENYCSKSFSSSAVCTCMKREKVNSIPSESWLDRVVGERRTEVEVICTCVGVPGFERV